MKEVWKYEVPVDDESHRIDIPDDARLIHVNAQRRDTVCMWYEVDTVELGDTRPRMRSFRVFGTGHPITPTWNWVGTAVWIDQFGPLVWHLYEDEAV